MEERIRYLFELQTAQALASLDRLRGKILNADLAMKKMNATTMTATANLMQMSKGGINRAAQSTQALSKGSVKASKGLGAMAGKAMLAMVGVAALMRVARMLGEEVTKSASAFREFEVRMAEVSTIVQDTDTHMLGLSAGVSSMSKQFGKSTSDLSRGLYDILSASVPVEDSLQMLEISAKAAAAGLTSVEKSVDVLTSVMNAYGLTVDQMTKVSDVMFKAVIHGKFRFEDLASSLGYVMPIAAQVGVRFEEIAAAIASATRQGQHVDMVARGLALSIQNIIKPSEGAQKAAEELSLSLSQASLRAYGLEGFMEKLAIATQGNAGAISEIIPNMRSYRVAMVLAANDASEMGKDVDRMTDSLDATEEAFEKVADTVDMSRNILVEYKNEMQRMVGSSTAELEKFTVKWDMFKASVLGFFTSGGTSIDSGKHPIAAALSGISPILGSITAGFLNTADASEMAAQTAAENIRKQVEALNAAPKQDIYEAFKSGETLIARPYDVLANDLIEAREEATALGLVLAEMKEMGAPESSAAMRQLTLDYQNAVDAVLEAEVAIGEWDGALKTASDAVEYYADSIDIVWEEMGRLTEQIEDLTQKYKENAAQIPIDYMNHWVSLLQEDSKYQEEFNEAVATGGENYDWYTAEMGEAITTIREYEQQTKETTATQNEFNEALARNRIETMKLQLIGMMRRRGNTRAELRALKSLSIQRTEMQIEEAQNKLDAEIAANEGIIDSGQMAYDEAKRLLDSIARDAEHNLWLIKDTRVEDLADLQDTIKNKEAIYADFNTQLGVLRTERNAAMRVEWKITKAMYDEESAEMDNLIAKQKELNALQSAKVPEPPKESSSGSSNFKSALSKAVTSTTKITPTKVPYKPTPSRSPSIMDNIVKVLRNPTAARFGFARGTNYVPSDGLYNLHKGEQVISNMHTNSNSENVVININVTGNNITKESESSLASEIADQVQKGLMTRDGKSKYRMR